MLNDFNRSLAADVILSYFRADTLEEILFTIINLVHWQNIVACKCV